MLCFFVWKKVSKVRVGSGVSVRREFKNREFSVKKVPTSKKERIGA